MTKRVVVSDDDEVLRDSLKSQIQSVIGERGVVEAQPVSWVHDNLDALERRMKLVRESTSSVALSEVPCDFDEVDILLLDFDLFDGSEDSLLETGNDLAYLIRWLSACKIVVVLNEEKTPGFDLRLPDGLDSYADLDIASDFAANARLWGGPTKLGEFAPWRWFDLFDASDRRSTQVQWLLTDDNLDAPALASLGHSADHRLASESLGSTGKRERLMATACERVSPRASKAGLRTHRCASRRAGRSHLGRTGLQVHRAYAPCRSGSARGRPSPYSTAACQHYRRRDPLARNHRVAERGVVGGVGFHEGEDLRDPSPRTVLLGQPTCMVLGFAGRL